MTRHHGDVGAPVFQPDQHTHSDFVYTGLPHAVESVAPPFEFRLHPGRVIYLVTVAVVGFLETYHAVKPRTGEAFVVFCRQWHHLYGEVAEIRAAHLQGFLDIVGPGHGRVFTCYNQQVLERPHCLNGLAFRLDLFGCQDYAREFVMPVEPAVNTRVGA